MIKTVSGDPVHRTSPLVVAHSKALEELPAILDELGSRRALLAVGPGRAALAERVTGLLGQRVIGSFTDAVAHVPSWEVNLAVASAQEVHADSVIAIGGGSTAGYAKIVALALRLPWVSIPATLAGAEMTSRYLVTTDTGKEAGSSARARARAVLYDPEVLDGVPPAVLASSGMSAVAACLEALARGVGAARASATNGLRTLWQTLPRLLDRPHDIDLRVHALTGAALAGTALEIAGPGPAQLIAEDLGARHRCDHGALMACLVPWSARSVSAVHELAGPGPAPELIQRFARSLRLPVRLSSVCPSPDPDALIAHLSTRVDLAGHADPATLRPLLECAA